MNITDLPQEVLLHIFAYLPKHNLILNVSKVCEQWNLICLSPSLWNRLDFKQTFQDILQPYKHLSKINHVIHKLIISPKDLNCLFECHRNIHWNNLKSLHVTEKVSNYFIDTVVDRCQHLNDIRFFPDLKSYMPRCLLSLSELNLVSIDVGYFYGSQDINEHFISFMNKQPNMKKVYLRGWYNLHDNTLAKIIDNCPSIVSLYSSNPKVSNMIFKTSTAPLALSEFTVHSSNFDDEGLKCLGKRAKNLRLINIENCKEITHRGVCHVAESCPLLEEIYCGNIYPLYTDVNFNLALHALAKGCPKLRNVYISYMGRLLNVHDDGIISLVSQCRKLTCLVSRVQMEITDVSLFAIGENCSFLEEIHFYNAVNITAKGLFVLLTCCKRLRRLYVQCCTSIVDVNEDTHNIVCNIKGLSNKQPLVETRQNLRQIEQTGDPTNTSSQVDSNLGIHSHLLELNMKSCLNVTTKTVLHLLKLCPDLRELDLANCFLDAEDITEFISHVFVSCSFLTQFNVQEAVVHKKDYV